MNRITDEKLAIIAKVGDSDAQTMAVELQDRRCQAEVPMNDLATLVSCAIRYALGRSTYITQHVAEMVKKYWPYIGNAAHARIRAEVGAALGNAKDKGTTVGMQADQDVWQDLNDWFQTQWEKSDAKRG